MRRAPRAADCELQAKKGIELHASEEMEAARRVSDCLPQQPAPTSSAEAPSGASIGCVSMNGALMSGDHTSAKPVSVPCGRRKRPGGGGVKMEAKAEKYSGQERGWSKAAGERSNMGAGVENICSLLGVTDLIAAVRIVGK